MSIYNKFIKFNIKGTGIIIPMGNINSIEYNPSQVCINFSNGGAEQNFCN